MTPLNSSLYGNYCIAAGGIGLREDPFTGTFSVNVAGAPVAAYWYWSGRTSQPPQANDPQIAVALNGAAAVTITADQSISSPVIYNDNIPRAWHTNVYQDANLALVVPNAVNNFTVSELTINGPAINFENHGTGVLIVYESADCPFQKIDVTFGLDSSHHTQTAPFGPDSEVFCTTFDPLAEPQTLSIDMFVGGVTENTRGNSIWYITGSGTPAYPTLVNDPNATEVFDPLNSSYQVEWDIFMDAIALDPGHTHACFQIESPEDDNGISDVWMGTATGLTLPPPSINITKSPDVQTVSVGAAANFTVTVENDSPYELSGVQVADGLSPDCDRALGTLAPGSIERFSCRLENVSLAFTNTAVVSGFSPFETTVSDQDDARVLISAIQINKSPDLQTVSAGSPVTFTVQVTNTGDVALNNVTVSDNLTPACFRDLGTMSPGASTSYTCAASSVSAAFTNEAVVTGEPEGADPVSDSDTADVQIVNPAIDIEKTPDVQVVVAGSAATFTIHITNTGDVTLADVAVVDPLAPTCNMSWPSLAPGATQSYTCALDGVAVPLTNIATATGKAPDGAEVSDQDSAEVETLGPSITVQKSPDDQTVLSGGSAIFNIRVENSGDVILTDVRVEDSVVPQCDNSIPNLAPSEVWSYDCMLDGATIDFTNVVTATGNPPVGPSVVDTDDAFVNVESPFIAITKSPNSQTVLAGAPVQFTISVTNTGTVDLLNVTVVDALALDCNRNLGTLVPGVPSSYSCTLPSAVASFTNLAVVTGNPALGGPQVTASDTAEIFVLQPAISIEKTPDEQTVVNGGSANFTIRVENQGNATLTNVVVSDPLTPACGRSFAQLEPAEVVQYDCASANVDVDFNNVATVSATPPLGPPLTDQDGGLVDVISPNIEIIKSPNEQLTVAGNGVEFTITVRNAGDAALTDVVVGDQLVPNCNRVIGDLASGQEASYTCTSDSVLSSFTNTAVVSGQSASGETVSDQDTASVVVVSPAISISKSVVQPELNPGDSAEFSIRVENTGDVILNDVLVNDALAPQCTNQLGTLNPGDSRAYSCILPNVQESLLNVAVVSGQPPVGNPVTAQDTAVVTVPQANLRISKTDGGLVSQPGGTIVYSLFFENRGPGNAFDVVITEVVPEFTRFNLEASTTGWQCEGGDTSPGTICTFSVGDLPAGASDTVDLVFVVDVASALPLDIEQINNVVTISGRNNSSLTGNNTSEDNTPIPPTSLDQTSEPETRARSTVYLPLIRTFP